MRRFNSNIVRVKNSSTGEYEPLAALRGYSSYELAVANGFEGTEAEWMESIIGDGWIGAYQDLEKLVNSNTDEIDGLKEDISETLQVISEIEHMISRDYNVTLTASAWIASDNGGYTQSISVEDITVDDCPHWSIVYSDDHATRMLEKEAFALVDELTTSDGSVTFICFEDAPEVDIQIQMEVNG